MAFLNLLSDLSSFHDLPRFFHSFEVKFVEAQRPQFLFEKALRTLSLDLIL